MKCNSLKRICRHNVGSAWVEALAEALGGEFKTHEDLHSDICEIGDAFLIRPRTYSLYFLIQISYMLCVAMSMHQDTVSQASWSI